MEHLSSISAFMEMVVMGLSSGQAICWLRYLFWGWADTACGRHADTALHSHPTDRTPCPCFSPSPSDDGNIQKHGYTKDTP